MVLRGQLTNSPPTLVRAIQVYRALPDLAASYPAKLVLADQRQAVRAQRPPSPDDALLVAEYQAGATIKSLSRRHRVPKDRIRRLMEQHEVRRTERTITENQVDHAVELYNRGQSLASIGQQLSLDAETIRTHLRRQNVVLRSPHHQRSSSTVRRGLQN